LSSAFTIKIEVGGLEKSFSGYMKPSLLYFVAVVDIESGVHLMNFLWEAVIMRDRKAILNLSLGLLKGRCRIWRPETAAEREKPDKRV